MPEVLDQVIVASAAPEEHRFAVKDYYRLGELGFFQDERVELIDGKIISMPPQGNAHDVAVKQIERTFEKLLGDAYWVRADLSINFASGSAPEPDIAIVAGNFQDCDAKPTSALLIIEVSETTLNFDRSSKALLYASNGISDYWIVNLVHKTLEVFRKAEPGISGRFTHRYSEIQTLNMDSYISPVAFPSLEIAVSQLFPKTRDARK